MKTKKVLLIPSALLCLAALAACGKNQSRFANGFESPELEEYFKLPSNLSYVSKDYGKYVYEISLMNSALAKTNETTLQIAGSSNFFNSDERNSTGKNYGTKVKGMSSPFSSTSSVIYGKNVTKMYDDVVSSHTEKSYRSTTNAKGQTTTSNETDMTYLNYMEEDATAINKYNAYSITKGTPSLLTGKWGDKDKIKEEIAYRTKLNDEPMDLEKIKVKIEQEANITMLDDFKLSIPLAGGMGTASLKNMLMQNCDLEPFNIATKTDTNDIFGKEKDNSDFLDKVNFFYDGNKSIYANLTQTYQQGYVLSPLQASTETLPTSLDNAIPAYQNIVMAAKFSIYNNQWRCDYAGTNTKIYVTKDENFRSYATPYCICSAYTCSKLNYDSCGNYGDVEKIEQEYSPTTYGFEVNIIDDNDTTLTHPYLYDAFDSNLEHVGGIYDYTMTFKKLAYPIKDNQRVFYGIFDFSENEVFITQDAEGNDIEEYSDNVSFVLNLKDRYGEKENVNLFSDTSKVTFDTTYLEWETNPSRLHVKKAGCTYQFTAIINIDDNGVFTSLESLDIQYYSSESSHSAPADVL